MTYLPRSNVSYLYRLSCLSISLAILSISPVHAFTFSSGELQGSLDTTISYGARWRVQDRDKAIIGIANGGTAYSVNGDDGNLNYDKGLVSNVIKITPELELKYRNYGAFVRGTYFYDFEVMNNDTARTPLSDAAKGEVGEKGELLDAYVWGSWNPGEKPLDVRIGNQVVNWGESTFIQGGMNSINPVNVNRLRVPGAELREALKPVPRLWANLGATDKISVEGFYQTTGQKRLLIRLAVTSVAVTSLVRGQNRSFSVLAVHLITQPSRTRLFPGVIPGTRKDGGEYGISMNYLTDDANGIWLLFCQLPQPVASHQCEYWQRCWSTWWRLLGERELFS